MTPKKISYKIRFAKASDLAVLPEIERRASVLYKDTKFAKAVGDDVTTLADFKEAQVHGCLFVAVDFNDQPVGFAFMEIMRQGVHLDELNVLPEYGGHGIGTALVKKVCAWAAENNYPVVTLTTYTDIPWNAPFYRKCGFIDLSREEIPEDLYTLFLNEHKSGLLMADRAVMIYKINPLC